MTCSNEIFEPVQMMEFYAEGYTGAVVDVLARQWSDLAQLQKLISHDEAFRIFVYRHTDSTAPKRELQIVLHNAQDKCAFEISQIVCRHCDPRRGRIRSAGQPEFGSLAKPAWIRRARQSRPTHYAAEMGGAFSGFRAATITSGRKASSRGMMVVVFEPGFG